MINKEVVAIQEKWKEIDAYAESHWDDAEFKAFEAEWWSTRQSLADSELGQNGQFDDLAYAAYAEALYSRRIE